MNAPLKNPSCRGLSVFELLIVFQLIVVVLGFAPVSLVQEAHSASRGDQH